MYQLTINELTAAEFLQQYWQKKPLLIKQGFKNFVDPIEAEELAGLAMEESIESRLITNHNDDWQAHHGPFEEFSLLTETNSTLLVQAVDHWHPTAAELMEAFRFIPNWRIDDLMVSYSTPGGGVGPHLDQYDVFIIQGAGKRHWRVGMPDANLKEFAQNDSLLQVEQFKATIDEVLEPGDILYIPPGCPHEGYAVENALNYSVGFRAPDTKDFISGFADYLIDNEAAKQRYSDKDLTLRESCGALKSSEIDSIRNLMTKVLNDDGLFNAWLGQYLSTPKNDMDLAPIEPTISHHELTDYLQQESTLYRAGGVRAFYQLVENHVIVSINAENFYLPDNTLSAVQLLTDNVEIEISLIKDAFSCIEFSQMLTKLLNDGTYFIAEDDEV